MAEGWSKPTKQVFCRYFMHGVCPKGNGCPFSHDKSHQASNVCRHYIQGHCSYGSACRYDHVRALKVGEQQRRSGQNPAKSTSFSNTPLSADAKEFHLPINTYCPPSMGQNYELTPLAAGNQMLINNTTVPPQPQSHALSLNHPICESTPLGYVVETNSQYAGETFSVYQQQQPLSSHQPATIASPPVFTPYHNGTSNMTVLRDSNRSCTSSNSLYNTLSNRYSSNNVAPPKNTSQSLSSNNTSSHNVTLTQASSRSSGRGGNNKAENNKKKIKLPTVQLPNKSWADAPEFVPRNYVPPAKEGLTWANIAGGSMNPSSQQMSQQQQASLVAATLSSELCPYYVMNQRCNLRERCPYVHGLVCDICLLACLHPNNAKQREDHVKECHKFIEAEMEHSFAVARSQDKQCGICMDTVMERTLPSQRRFGILPNCSHIYCLDCIRKWRQSKQFENKIIRSCPECRIQSDYIIPSRYWVDETDKEEKTKLVDSYRDALGKKECKYFNKGEGTCPFGNKCFYRHALSDGTVKDVGPPRRRRRIGADGEMQVYLDNMVLWDFMDEREHRLELLRGSIQSLLLELELEDFADNLYIGQISETESD